MSEGVWIAVLDARSGRLIHATRTKRGSPHADELACVEDPWELKEHGRPSRRRGKTEESYASSRHEEDERRRRFAQHTGGWLEREARERGIRRLHLFAPARLLGTLRAVWSSTLAAMLEQRVADLAGWSLSDLSRHPSVLELLPHEDRGAKT